jgi:hypothetical protein
MNVPNDLNPREAAEALRTLARALEAYMVENGARLIDESDPEMPMTISFGGYRYETTLGVIQDLDRAYAETFERNQKAACRRRDRKAVGRLV